MEDELSLSPEVMRALQEVLSGQTDRPRMAIMNAPDSEDDNKPAEAGTPSGLPRDNREYKNKDYWEKRYESEKEYDWFKTYHDLKPIFDTYFDKSDNILQIGCGNSILAAEMFHDGYTSITNMDYSPVVIQGMKEKYADLPGLTWDVMDVRDLKYPDASFDVVLDKGTMDALLVEETEESATDVAKMCTEISRVLKPGGIYMQITFTQPHFRKKYLLRPEYGWQLEVKQIGEFIFTYFFYIMKKSTDLSGESNTQK